MSSLRLGAGAVLVGLSVVAGLAGCDTGDGRALADPAPGATAPPLATSTTPTTATLGTTPGGSAEASELALTSAAFDDGAPIDARFTSCDGDNLSPPLSWTGVPPGTVELVVTAVDPDAPSGPLVHWVVAGIDPVVAGFGEGGLPETAVDVRPWIGPCPPGGETHDYVFTLYALTAPSGIAPGDDVEAALAAVESTPGPAATLRGTYSRPMDA